MAAASVFALPDGFVLPPVDELITDRPATLYGLLLEWTRHSKPDPVFIRAFALPTEAEAPQVYLFGARHPNRDCLIDGESWADEGFFIEYFAVDASAYGGWSVHRLRQRGHSVLYSDRDESEQDYVPAKKIKDPNALSIKNPPAWKLWAADWPTCDGHPMLFLGQVTPPENQVTRERLSWVHTIYLFGAVTPDGMRYKITEQDRGAQTAEEHYELEEQLAQDG
jgi:hypothetical protein